ncbi:hypothetical protein IT6_07115 [Methylacidiphilum caldifontis]|uniref:hypothetical protein n=1 Tax=Methylacidiphilum caldifontis TaxID=2795386 RepID=UPI001A8F95CC|nr:hypothetical protein [Methylacidiphilum caldifontis]QSR88153.1 hypothetical protein IT6_07115 [Methylacidiphilum caldifontis]
MSNEPYGTLLGAISLDGKFLTQEFSLDLLCQRLLTLKEDSIEILTDLDWTIPSHFRFKKFNPQSFDLNVASLKAPFFLLCSPLANKLALEVGIVSRISVLWTPSFYLGKKQYLFDAFLAANKRIKLNLESWEIFPEGCACHYKIAKH